MDEQFERFIEQSKRYGDKSIPEIFDQLDKLREALEAIHLKAMAFQPDSIGENPILYRWVGEIKVMAKEALEEKQRG
jgi:hypothetical protein